MHVDVLQLTDLHVMQDRQATMRGIPTYDALVECLRFIEEGEASGRWDFRHILVTGDLVHDGQLGSYERFRELFGKWTSRCRIIPGNHDDHASMRSVFPERVSLDGSHITFSVKAGDWRLIGLDSCVAGESAGRISARQMSWLSQELTLHRAEPTILFVHHPPFLVGSAWLDQIGLRDPAPLIGLVGSFPQVRAISAGHVHQQHESIFGEVELLTTPSTAVQYCSHQDVPVCDPIPPGFRIFRFTSGTFHTEVVRLPSLSFPPSG